MSSIGVWWKRLASAIVAASAVAAAVAVAPAILLPARAQAPRPAADPDLRKGALDPAEGAPELPPPPPQGAWAEVIMATPKWLVVQNHQGQQFPIAMDAIGQFLIRWPYTLDELTEESVIEAIGPDLGSNTMRTEHVDVFEGADRSLVAPTYSSVLPNNRLVTAIDPGFNRFMNGFDIGTQNLLYGWAYPIAPANATMPARLHVVGNAVNANPLRVSVLGNNFATILPVEPGGMSITRVTRGNSSFAEKGDLAYLMPLETTPRTVTLSQVVLYKKIPIRRFRMP
jgi:hypothetical protein